MEVTTAASPAPVAPPAPPVAAPSAPTGESPAAAAETPQAPAGETPAKTAEETEADRQRRVNRRINTAYRKAAEAQARAEFAEKQLNEIRASQQRPVDPAAPAAPRLEHFKTLEEYTAATEKYAKDYAKYESERAVKDIQTKQQGETQKQAQARLLEGWESMTERGEGKYADFTDVVGEITPTTPWAMAVMSAENGDEVAYELGKNLKEAERIAKLPPLMQILEIGRLSAKLAAKPVTPPTPSKAPAPITPVTGTPPSPASLDDPKMSDAEWMRRRQAEVNKRRGRV